MIMIRGNGLSRVIYTGDVSDNEEDFAAMFEASVKARQFNRGQTIQGTIVGFGPKVAFVNVGGKG